MRQVSQIKLPLVAFALLLFFLSTHGVAADNDGVGGKQALRVYVFGVISESAFQSKDGIAGRLVHKGREYELFPIPIAVISFADIVQPVTPEMQQVVVRLPPGGRVSPRGFSGFERIAYVVYRHPGNTLVVKSVAKLVGADQIKDELSVPASVFSIDAGTNELVPKGK